MKPVHPIPHNHLNSRSLCRPSRPEPVTTPTLRFTPTAWAKLHYLCHAGPTEIGGFAISAEGDPLLVQDFALIDQVTSAVSVVFNDAAVADFFETQVDEGRRPDQFMRIWCHTHPGDCPNPSMTDEDTFDRVFGGCDWAVMFILARETATYARLRFTAGPGGELLIPVAVDYEASFEGSDQLAWQDEYDGHVQPSVVQSAIESCLLPGADFGSDLNDRWLEVAERHERRRSSHMVEASNPFGTSHFDAEVWP